jgi:Ni/Co efflux regulator RcnB
MGRSLPPTVVYHEVAPVYYTQYRLAPPPPRHRYVRVGNDILLVAIASGLIASAIYDIAHHH